MAPSSIAVLISTFSVAYVHGISIKDRPALLPTKDQLLQVSLGPKSEHEDCYGGFNAINPSFSHIPGSGRMAVAMRALCLHKSGDHAIWLSKVLLGSTDASAIRQPTRESINWRSFHVAPDPRTANVPIPMTECQIPALDRADGPEDPRLVKTSAGLFLIVAGYAVVPAKAGIHERPVCGQHGFLLHASRVESLSPPRFGRSVMLTFEGMGRVEKNWAMFASDETHDANVHAIYSVYPHKIATVNLQRGHVSFDYETYAESVVTLAQYLKVEPHDFHGGAGIAHVVGEQKYYLSIMHVGVLNSEGQTEYWNFPYKFQAEPPFAITHIGKRLFLKLEGNPIYGGELVAFVTTLMYDEGDVFVGYGSGDREARTLRISLKEFDSTYFPTEFLQGHEQLNGYTGSFAQRSVDIVSSNSTPACRHPVHNKVCRDRLTTSICRACPSSE